MKLCLIIVLTLSLNVQKSNASISSLLSLFSNQTAGSLIDLLPFKIDGLANYFKENLRGNDRLSPLTTSRPSPLPLSKEANFTKRVKVGVGDLLVKKVKDFKHQHHTIPGTTHTTTSNTSSTTSTTSSTTSTTSSTSSTTTPTPPPALPFPKASYQDKTKIEKKLQFLNRVCNQTQNVMSPCPKDEKPKNNPYTHMTTLQMIAMDGYQAESHTVVTRDGYILALHRIPHSKYNFTISHKTVLLHHGLLGSSADWVIAGKGKALPYLLSDRGYDVWLANVRGNTYSRAHISRPVNSFAFWNFSFHEVSQYDLPAIINYIMDLKGPDTKINYIGHSMGTTILFALLSTQVQYNKILHAGYALAPVAYMSDIRSPLWFLAKFSDDIEFLFKLFGQYEFLPQSAVLQWLSKNMCELYDFEKVICENILFVICGHDPKQFNKTLLPIILGHEPAGASVKTMIHYAQEIRAGGKFQQFDYGSQKNLIYYGTPLPPQYPVERITLPIALLSAQNDWLASEVDVDNLHKNLPNVIDHYIVPFKQFNHLDFLWAIDAPKLVYQKLFELMKDEVVTKKPGHDDNFSNCALRTPTPNNFGLKPTVLNTKTAITKAIIGEIDSLEVERKKIQLETRKIPIKVNTEKVYTVSSNDNTAVIQNEASLNNEPMENLEPIALFNYGFSYENEQNTQEHIDNMNFEI